MSEFKYLTKKTAKDCEVGWKYEEQFTEIAYQLKRIADALSMVGEEK